MERQSGGLDLVVDVLVCPLCHAAVTRDAAVIVCRSGHVFDIARQGYVSLTTGRAPAGDTAPMIDARERFLGAGHYDPIVGAIVDAVPADAAGVAVDVGGGTGYHLARVVSARAGLVGLVLDTSKPAIRRAARAHERLAAVIADAWAGLPLATDGVAVVLSVFAPRNPLETLRVLGPDGLLVVVTPTARHLSELVGAVGLVSVDDRKEERLARQLAEFRPDGSLLVEYPITLDRRAAVDDVLMGPSGHHADAATIAAALESLPDPLEATVSVTVSAFRPGVGGPR